MLNVTPASLNFCAVCADVHLKKNIPINLDSLILLHVNSLPWSSAGAEQLQ